MKRILILFIFIGVFGLSVPHADAETDSTSSKMSIMFVADPNHPPANPNYEKVRVPENEGTSIKVASATLPQTGDTGKNSLVWIGGGILLLALTLVKKLNFQRASLKAKD